jgi:N-methylhydantoinase A/oxoprolinase/acetone carboxylase beta subunit
VAKVLSEPSDPANALARGLSTLAGQGPVEELTHGTTVATNALIERSGPTVSLVATTGCGDLIEIARQNRPRLYDQWADRPPPLVDRDHRFEVGGRLSADGSELAEVDVDGLAGLPADPGPVAVCLLHADINDAHERAVADALRSAGREVIASHEVSPEMREYERTTTTVVNAYLRQPCGPYLEALSALAAQVGILTSAGGLVPVEVAASTPAALLLSGPAGGVRAAADLARAAGHPDAISFDMGGTSTDVCLIASGRPAPASQRMVAGVPVRLPALDVHTIGAGGGSIAAVDRAGALWVGPRSAGSRPGPACYGRGGSDPTVTDANLLVGRIPADAVLGDLGRLDAGAAASALAGLGLGAPEPAAAGVIDVVETAMEQALRAVSVEQGVDPSGLALIAFGGAGPLHACPLADRMGITTVLVPPRAGVFSAVGVLAAPDQRDLVRSWPTPGDHTGLPEALAALADEAVAALGPGEPGTAPVVRTEVDARYQGQSHELRVADVASFPAEHDRRNGYLRPGVPVEVIALRATARRDAPLSPTDLPDEPRSPVVGPAVVAEAETTIWVPEGWVGAPGPAGALVLERSS